FSALVPFRPQPAELGRRLQELRRARFRKLRAGAEAPQDAERTYAIAQCTCYVVAAVADHDGLLGRQALRVENVRNQFGLVGACSVELAAVQPVEERREPEVLDDAGCVDQ